MDRGAWRATVHGSQESKPPPGAFSHCAWWDLPHEIWMLVCHPSSRPCCIQFPVIIHLGLPNTWLSRCPGRRGFRKLLDSVKLKENRNDIISLEEKIAWLEDIIDRQSKELSDLYDKMDKLERQFKVLYSKVGDPYATRSQKDEVPPPHY